MTARIALLFIGLLLVVPASAQAGSAFATADMQCDGDEQDPACRTLHQVTFNAAPGEVNDVTVERTVDAVLVRDAGAPITPGPGCTALAADQVRCLMSPSPGTQIDQEAAITINGGDGDDRLQAVIAAGARLDTVFLRGQDGADRLTGPAVTPVPTGPAVAPAWLEGGAGADELNGGDVRELLIGGTEPDVLRAGGGDDVLDGEGSAAGAPTVTPPAPDVLDGGAGRDEVTYQNTAGAVTVDLADPAPDGQAGFEDTLTGIEDVRGSLDGPNVLLGDDGPNRLTGSATPGAADRIEGRGGPDDLRAFGRDADALVGGDGDDVLTSGPGARCGLGVDTWTTLNGRGVRLPSDCERAAVNGLVIDVRPVSVSARRTVLRVRPDPQYSDGTFRGRIEVRSRGRLIGTRAIRLRPGESRQVAVRTRRRPARGATVSAQFTGTLTEGSPAVRLRR